MIQCFDVYEWMVVCTTEQRLSNADHVKVRIMKLCGVFAVQQAQDGRQREGCIFRCVE